ncbi:MAG TPA: ATP-binding protein, partial [Clostridia bacterium]|nr:ATP-binding protein [Clostridia bacterium]
NYTALVTASNKPMFISASCSPIYSGSTAIGVVVVFRDIDRIKLIEEEIRKEKDNLKNVFEALPIGIMLVEADSTVKWLNKPLLELFHTTEQQLLNRRFGDGVCCKNSFLKGCGRQDSCIECELQKYISDALKNRISQKNLIVQRTFIFDKTPRNLWLKLSFIPMSGLIEQAVVAVEDITEQKEYENALQKSRDESASANRIKSEFIANMSHEIRTPLNGIIGMMELLINSGLNDEQVEYIRLAKMSADTLLKVIGNILDFSRIESGSVTLSNISFDFALLMDELFKMHEALALQKGLRFNSSLDPNIPQVLKGDPDRLRQVLNNLLGNAIKFTDGGEVSVALTCVGLSKTAAAVEFVISDTGIGISKEKMDLLFKRFSQADGSSTRRHSGAGLGLAISKQLVELMGGSIKAESAIGKGSTFKLKIEFQYDCKKPLNEEEQPKDVQPTILTDSEELGLFRKQEQIVILESPGQDEGGGIHFNSNCELYAKPKMQANKASEGALKMLLSLAESVKALEGTDYSHIEETAHRLKIAALGAGELLLGEEAFKAELLSRKGRFVDALNLCLSIANEVNTRFKEDENEDFNS